jgi:hypothetical protein
MNKLGLVAAGLLTTLAVSGGVPRANAAGTSTPTPTSITVSAQGSVSVTPDEALVTVGVQETDLQASKAQAQANTVIAAAIARIKALGIPSRDIQTQSISLDPQYDQNGALTGFQASDTLSITVEQPAKAGVVIDAGVAAGANKNVTVGFGLKDDSQAISQALQAAVTTAKKKAAAVAAEMGISLRGATVQITENTAQTPVPVQYSLVGGAAKSAATPIQTGTLLVQDSVTLTYTL